MHFILATAFTAIVSSVVARPAPAAHVSHERRDFIPESWVKGDRIPSHHELPVRIGLTQSNLDKGHDLLMEVSDPDSPKYGKHYTEEEVHNIFAPSNESVQAVKSWLESSGIKLDRVSQSFNKQWIQFDAFVHELENLLKTQYHAYEHVPTGKGNIACDEYHVPEDIRHHIDYITPGIKLHIFQKPEHRRAEAALEKRTTFGKGLKLPPIVTPLPGLLADLLALPLDELCGEAITPDCLRALYDIPDPSTNTAVKGNTLGIFEDLDDVLSLTDLDEFFATVAQNVPVGTKPYIRNVDGAKAPLTGLGGGDESALDFEISYSLIYPQQIALYQTDDPHYEANYTYRGFLNNFLDAIDGSYCHHGGKSPLDPPYPDPAKNGYKGQKQCGKYPRTNVISISYGGAEASLPVGYQRRQCHEFMKLGMQGTSVVVSSGDHGVSATGKCPLNGGKSFLPDFPATCPYITTAGATFLPTGSPPNQGQEQATTQFASGGGFSNIYAIPDYQKSHVEKYLKAHKPNYTSYETLNNPRAKGVNGVYNHAGRGYPDISSLGENFIIFADGMPNLVGGTSAAAPAFSSILTLINEHRLKAGKSTIGFVNPVLYKNPEALTDITVGSNPACGLDGFKTAPGWDPVTGLGSPKFPKLLDLFMKLG